MSLYEKWGLHMQGHVSPVKGEKIELKTNLILLE